jgi:hypothetical protein
MEIVMDIDEILRDPRVRALLEEAARRGAQAAIDNLVLYTMGDAAKRMGIAYSTLRKRVLEGKIRTTDGKVSGVEIRRYLSGSGREL